MPSLTLQKTILALAIALSTPAMAQDSNPSSQQIIEALLPLDMHGQRIKGARSTDALFDGAASSRAIKVVDGVQVPTIDLRVAFNYDSDQLSNDAHLVLERLATAMSSPELQSSGFRIIGHTDARGSDEYNDELSHRRAAAVVTWLASRGIDTARIEVGHRGKRELLTDIAGDDERNRRVEIQNTGAYTPG